MNCIDKMMLLQSKGLIKQGVTEIDVEHDDWCQTLKTGDSTDCNCNPNIVDKKTRKKLA